MENIVIATFKYPPVYSGYGRQLKSVLNEINKCNELFHFKILTAYSDSEEERSKNIDIISFLNRSYNLKVDTYIFAIRLFCWLIFHLKEYSIIHCVKAGSEAVVCNIISKIFKKKLIVKVVQEEFSDRELYSSNGKKRLDKVIRHFLLRDVDNFIAISEEIEDNLNKRTNKSIVHRIPNGVDIEKFKPVCSQEKKKLREKVDIDKEVIALLHVGAINTRKGVYDILNALEEYNGKKIIQFVMCGPVLEDLSFLDRISELNKNNNLIIDYRGSVDNVTDYLNSSDIFVLASYSEGLPNVLLEAGASGLPIISTNIGGSRDIIQEGINGLLVEKGNINQIYNTINKLVENEKLRQELTLNSRETIVNRFSNKKIANQYENLYKNLLSIN